MIGFTILSFHESKKRAKFLEERTKAIKKAERAREGYLISFDELKKDLQYEPSIDLLCTMKYF